MVITLDMARAALQSQPFSVLIGAEIVAFGRDGVELRVPIADNLKQQFGFVHGGVIAYAADNALTFAGGSILGPSVVTSEFKINYLSPAQGETLIARAVPVHAGTSQVVCRCDLFCVIDGVEKLCAIAQGTIAPLGQRK